MAARTNTFSNTALNVWARGAVPTVMNSPRATTVGMIMPMAIALAFPTFPKPLKNCSSLSRI
jgi:hypothetical protein